MLLSYTESSMVSFVMEEAIIVIEATDIYLQTSVAIIA